MSSLARRKLPLVILAACLIGAPSAAAAPSAVTILGDDGNPVPLTNGATIRNMATKIGVAPPAAGENYAMAVTGPDGAAAGGFTCRLGEGSAYVDYRGSGAYTVTIRTFGPKDYSCATPTGTLSYSFSIASSVAISGPTGLVGLRPANSFRKNSVSISAQLNPGAISTEIRSAIGATLGPDGGIAGPSSEGFLDRNTGLSSLLLSEPGVYTVVARQGGGMAADGQRYYTPWSNPVRFTVKAPFDLLTRPFWSDSRGPNYRIRLRLADNYARGGKVSFSIARGKKGKYRSYGRARITSKGGISKALHLPRTGSYRMRVTYKGGSKVLAGRITVKFRIKHRYI